MADTRPVSVVFGGSFNPPTVAHKAMIAHVLDAAGADPAILVPSSDAYVRRKCAKTGNRILFTERERLDMLKDTASGDPRVRIGTFEFGDDGRGHTYRTMCLARDAFPDHRLLFLLGADKLRIVPRWRDAERFLSEFGILAVARAGSDPRTLILSDPLLAAHGRNITAVPAPDGYSDVSSSLFQEKLLARDPSAAELVTPFVYGLASRVLDSGRPAVPARPRKKGRP